MLHETGSGDGAPPRALVTMVRTIDGLAIWGGRISCWLVVPLVAALTYEVFARYVFHAPTIWAYDVAYMLYGTHFMLGAAYTLYRGGHIRTDLFYQNWSVRTRGRIDASPWRPILYPFKAVIPLALLLLMVQGVSEFLKSAYAALAGRELVSGHGLPAGGEV